MQDCAEATSDEAADARDLSIGGVGTIVEEEVEQVD